MLCHRFDDDIVDRDGHGDDDGGHDCGDDNAMVLGRRRRRIACLAID